MRRRWRVVIVLAALGFPQMTGCSYSIKMEPPGSERVATASRRANAAAMVTSVKLSSMNREAGVTIPGMTESQQRSVIENKLREAGFFREVKELASPDDRVFRLSFVIESTLEPHHGEAVGNGFLIAFSFGLLAPFLHYHVEYDESIDAEVVTPDGGTRQYRVQTHATATHKLNPGIDRRLVEVTHDQLMNEVVNKIIKDDRGS